MAQTKTYILRPTSDVALNGSSKTEWTEFPVDGNPAWAYIDDPATQPSATGVDLSDGMRSTAALGPGQANWWRGSVGPVPILGSVEVVTSVKTWLYCTIVSANHSMVSELFSYASVEGLVAGPFGPGWKAWTYPSGTMPKQADLNRIGFQIRVDEPTTAEAGNSSVYAAYVELTTSLPDNSGTTYGGFNYGTGSYGRRSIQVLTLTAAVETDTAQAATAAKFDDLALAAETDTAQALSKTLPVTLATEADSALAVSAAKVIDLVPATETDTAQTVTRAGAVPGHIVPNEFASATDAATTATITVAKPANLADGDVLIAFIASNGGTITAAPSGWTLATNQISINPRHHAYWKRVTTASGEPSTYSWTLSGIFAWAITARRFTGVDATTQLDVTATSANDATGNSPAVAPTLTTVTANAMIASSVACNSSVATFTPPGGTTEWYDSAAGKSLAAGTDELATAGASGTRSWPISATPRAWTGITVALRPALVAPTTYTLTPASETDSAQAASFQKVATVTQGAETDSALALVAQKVAAPAFAPETDTAQQVTSTRTLAPCAETDSALALTFTRTVAPASETDAAQAITRQKVATPTVATETDTAVAITSTRTLAPRTETDAALAVTFTRTVAPSSETDAAQTITAQKIAAATFATETDSAQAVPAQKTRAVTQAAETDSAQAITFTRTLAPALEPDAALALSYTHTAAFPTTPIVDDFNRADGPLGTNWTNDTFGVGSGAADIIGNQWRTGSSGYSEEYWNPQTFTGKVEVYATFAALGTGSWGAYVGMVQTPGSSATDGYQAEVLANGRCRIYRYDNAAITLLNGTASGAVTPAAGMKLGLGFDTGTLTLYVDPNGVSGYSAVVTATDATYNFASTPATLELATSEAARTFRVDDFGGGVLVTSRTLTPATETDSGTAVTFQKVAAATLAAETDSAQSVAASKVRALTLAAETDAALAVTFTRTLAPTAETDAALALTFTRTLAPSSETDTALAISSSQGTSRTLVAATETDSAQAATFTRTVAPSVQTNTALALAFQKVATPAPATETDSAQLVTSTRTIPPVAETDAAQAISRTKTGAAAAASETDTALALTFTRTLAPCQETDTAQTVGQTGVRTVAAATETDSAQPITAAKTRTLVAASETDAALGLVRGRLLIAAVETDSIVDLVTSGTITYLDVVRVAETDTAQAAAYAVVARFVETSADTGGAVEVTLGIVSTADGTLTVAGTIEGKPTTTTTIDTDLQLTGTVD